MKITLNTERALLALKRIKYNTNLTFGSFAVIFPLIVFLGMLYNNTFYTYVINLLGANQDNISQWLSFLTGLFLLVVYVLKRDYEKNIIREREEYWSCQRKARFDAAIEYVQCNKKLKE